MRNTTRTLALVALAASISGCGPNRWTVEGFKHPGYGGLKRAAFEMECPESQLQVTDLGHDSNTVGVTGCGKKAVFKWVYGAGWVNNTAVPEKP